MLSITDLLDSADVYHPSTLILTLYYVFHVLKGGEGAPNFFLRKVVSLEE